MFLNQLLRRSFLHHVHHDAHLHHAHLHHDVPHSHDHHHVRLHDHRHEKVYHTNFQDYQLKHQNNPNHLSLIYQISLPQLQNQSYLHNLNFLHAHLHHDVLHHHAHHALLHGWWHHWEYHSFQIRYFYIQN